jgi:hypothetical protein
MVKIRFNDNYEVLTSDGFKPFKGCKQLTSSEIIRLVFDDSTSIGVTPYHEFKHNSETVIAKDIDVGQQLGKKMVVSVSTSYDTERVYDLLDVEGDNTYLTEDIDSHNCAFIEDWETFFTAVAPTISSGKTTKMILVSTPNGLNHYHKLWVNAINGRSDYNAIKVTWREVPGRDEEWRKKTLSDLNFDMDKFNQENEAEFLGSSGTLISGAVLGNLVHQPTVYEFDGLRQYYKPEPGHLYTMVADVSKGVGLDYQACSIIDVTKMPYQQVATYYNNNTLAGDYAQILYNMAKVYNDATILVEINSPAGEQVSNLLIEEYEYDGVLFTENAGRAGKRISMGGMGTKGGIDKGVNTNKAVKQSGCSILKALVENSQLIINDYESISELSTFTRKGSSYEAEPGKHDDLTMTLVLFSWLTDQRFFKEMTDINTLQKLRRDDEEDIDNRMVGFGLLVDRGEDDDMYPHQDIWHSDKYVTDLNLNEQYNNLFS